MKRGFALIFLVLIFVLITFGAYYFVKISPTKQKNLVPPQSSPNFRYSTYSQACPDLCKEFKPRVLLNRPLHTQLSSSFRNGMIVVQFADDSGVRLREGKLISITNANLDQLNNVLSQYPVSIERAFKSETEEEISGELYNLEMSKQEILRDSNLTYILRFPEMKYEDIEKFVDQLNTLPVGEIASVEPKVTNP